MRFHVSAAVIACAVFVLPGDLGAQQLSAEGDIPGMKVMVQELKRDEGGTLTLRFQLVNDSDQRLADSCAFRETGSESCGPVSGVHLLDAANKKKYLVVRDSSQKCVCSIFRPVEKGGRMNHWVKFPAPPPNVQKVTVIVPQFQPVEGVPISGP
jgi:hypothetical protein